MSLHSDNQWTKNNPNYIKNILKQNNVIIKHRNSINSSKSYKNKYKLSIGIICIRYNKIKKDYEFLMIRRRTTYAFLDFINQKYNNNDHDRLTYLFNNMTLDEKIIIASKDFSYIWRYAKPYDQSVKTYYYKCSNYFDDNFGKPNDKRLFNLLSNTKNVEIEYEFPKGRKNYMERDLDTGIREFEEETKISKSDIKIIPNFQIKRIFKADNVMYKYKFYLAFQNEYNDVKLQFNDKEQLIEISNMKWLTLKEYNILHGKDKLSSINGYSNIMLTIKKYIKNKKINSYLIY